VGVGAFGNPDFRSEMRDPEDVRRQRRKDAESEVWQARTAIPGSPQAANAAGGSGSAALEYLAREKQMSDMDLDDGERAAAIEYLEKKTGYRPNEAQRGSSYAFANRNNPHSITRS
jgi:hypothetical protein